MPKVKRYIYSPNTIVLDMKKQPDAETMLRIAKSIKGAKVEVVKGGQIVMIHYPEAKEHFRIHTKVKSGKSFWEGLETGFVRLSSGEQKSQKTEDEKTTDPRLYHALILK